MTPTPTSSRGLLFRGDDQAGRTTGEPFTPDPEKAMMNFLLIRHPRVDDFNRYEVLHELRSRADTMLDGWLRNRLAGKRTMDSYIRGTYGSRLSLPLRRKTV